MLLEQPVEPKKLKINKHKDDFFTLGLKAMMIEKGIGLEEAIEIYKKEIGIGPQHGIEHRDGLAQAIKKLRAELGQNN